MADKTINYGLTKPKPEDFYNVDVQNENMDIIDTVLKDKASAPFIAQLTGNYKDGYQIDKTFNDIVTAFNEGRDLWVFDAASSVRIFRFVKASGSNAYFAYNNGEDAVSLVVNKNNTVTVTSLSFLKEDHANDITAHDDIRDLASTAATTANSAMSTAENALNKVDGLTALKNPNKLTINNVTYDGATAVDMTNAVKSLIEAELGVIENGTY